MEHPAAATFRTHVLAGDWVKADHDLRALHDLLSETPHVDPHNLAVSITAGRVITAHLHFDVKKGTLCTLNVRL